MEVPVCEGLPDGDELAASTEHAYGNMELNLPTREDTSVTIDVNMYNLNTKCDIVDLYSVEGESERAKDSVPFMHVAQLQGPKGEIVRVYAVVDNSAMCGALDSEFFGKVSGRLSAL